MLPSGPGGMLYLSFVFTTLDGALADGHECDVFDTCDLFFHICVKSDIIRDCDIFKITTSTSQNVASVTYDGDSAFQFSFRPPMNKIYVVIEAWEHDIVSNSDYIGRVQGIAYIQNITSLDTPLKLERSKTFFLNDFKIEASMRKECNYNYFGQICQYRVNESGSNSTIYQKTVELQTESIKSTTSAPETNTFCARASKIIGSNVCLNHGTCHDDIDGTGYVCRCQPGYTGTRCERLDLCHNITCSGHGECENVKGSTETFVCNCNLGWKGVLCEVPELSACEVAFRRLGKDQLSICLNGGFCVENVNEFGSHCQCENGWMGERCETHFTQTITFIAPVVLITVFVISALFCTYFRKNVNFKITKNRKRPTAEVHYDSEDPYSSLEF
nr:neurogenic locus notch protein 4 [Hymenolepis microstoma]